jgi:sugar O-acyltransferase (sialic acid O-acetyltransferase NeuD family)
MNRPFYIIGAGGLGREIKCVVDRIADPKHEFLGYLDDDLNKEGVVGPIDQESIGDAFAVMGVGQPSIRQKIIDRLQLAEDRWVTLIDPDAILMDPENIHIGPGSVVSAGTILTTNIQIGSLSFINLSCTVGHDAHIGSGSCIMPGTHISGDVNISNNVFIGTGAVILPGLGIGENSSLGAGSVLTKDIPANQTWFGQPACPR